MSQRDPSRPLPESPDVECGRAMQLQLAGQLDQAELIYRSILRNEPRHAAANHCLGMLLVHKKHAADALPLLRVALEAAPQVGDYWLGLLEALLAAGLVDEAAATWMQGRAQGLAGRAVDEFGGRLAEHMEGVLLRLLNLAQFADAERLCGLLQMTFPQRGLGWKTMGALRWARGDRQAAVSAMQTAVRLAPADAEGWSNLGGSLVQLDRLEEAEAALNTAIGLDARLASAHAHLGGLHELQGLHARAETSLRRAIELGSDDGTRLTSLLFMMSHNPLVDADRLFAEHVRIGDLFERDQPRPWPRHGNDPAPERRLKVGFISGDFRDHAVASFIDRVLPGLSACAGLELHGYYNHDVEDDVTRRIRGRFRHWRQVRRLTDTECAALIRADRIDILIDLSGHTAFNRLRALALKPAPIQASWLGYPGTTGLRAMDYYLADRQFLPPGRFDRYFTEKLVYLPASAIFQPHPGSPEVNPPPSLGGAITFGSFNRMAKITSASIEIWSEVLKAVPSSSLFLGSAPTHGLPLRVLAEFAARGIPAARIELHPRCPMDEYLALHHRVDICLDTVPYGGGTTTHHAAWMGVPTLTLAGDTPPGRQGADIMGLLGLEQFIAPDVADFVAKAVYWAAHPDELAVLRAGLRERSRQSPFQQTDALVAALEGALRHMWRRWCAGLPAESF
jgi:predicted O-linked N-acetylglucosamine transferase (SPINDLY family)